MDEHKDNKALERIEQHDVERLSPLVATGLRLLQQAPNPEALRELLAVQRDWEANEARKAYAVALAALKRDLPSTITKDKLVDYTSAKGRTMYRHATLAHVLDQVTGALTQHGFALTWNPDTGKDGVTVTCRLTHAGGHFEETKISAAVDNSGGKNAVQGVGSTITYLQRYTALSLLGIATADMDDADEEPEQKSADPSRIDPERNLRAIGLLKKRGKTVEAAVAFLGNRSVEQWTADDLAKLDTWSKPTEGAA